MLLSGILTSCEIWNNISDKHYTLLEQCDEYLLRGIMKAHSKTAKEFLYLDCGVQPIRFTVQSRRLMYLHHLLTRDKDELISRVYFSQLRRPGKKDWAVLVEKDLVEVGLNLSHTQIKGMKKDSYKDLVKKKIKDCAFEYLQNIKISHSKVKNIEYCKLELAEYLQDK